MPTTIKDALAWAQITLPRLESRLLLAAILKQTIPYLIAYDDTPLTSAEWDDYQSNVFRAQQGEPIPYIIGSAPFYGRNFFVSPAVLIPRPETEQLVEEALTFCRQRPFTKLIDVGTGSGCIAVTLAAELESTQIEIWATDVSPKALAVAQQNGRQQAQIINFMLTNLLKDVDGPFDLIVANLPYITQAEFAELDVSVHNYEPTLALVGGADGLDLIRHLLHQARTKITAHGVILLEIGWRQGGGATAVAQTIFPEATIICLKDYAGHDRLIKIELQ